MNTNFVSSFISAMSILKRVQKLGLRVRFVSNSGSGLFSLEGKIEEASEKRLLVAGEKCTALVDWGIVIPCKVVDIGGSEYSFLLHFMLANDDFFDVVGLDHFPMEPRGVVN